MIGFSIGKMKVIQGGWDNMDNGFRDHAQGVYAQHLAFHTYEPMIAMNVKAGGDISLQVLNDVTTADGGSWNETAHPTFVLGWNGDFAGIGPMLAFGSYDNNKSRYFDIGAHASIAGSKVTLDYENNQHSTKGYKAGDTKAKSFNDVSNSITFKGSYLIPGVVTPGVYFSTYDLKENTENGAKDIKYNRAFGRDATTGAPTGKPDVAFNDNGQTWAVSLDVNALGKGWTPYIAYVSESGKFEKSATDTSTQTRTDGDLRIGVLGEF
jgi:hypothetical protein